MEVRNRLESGAAIGLKQVEPVWPERVLELLREKGADDIVLFGGGIIPPEDIVALKALGVKELFTPGTSIQDIVRFVRENIRTAV